MNGTESNGHQDGARVAGARPVVLVRYRAGVVAESDRTVHLTALPPLGEHPVVPSALCGALLFPGLIEQVTTGHGVPCSLCMVSHLADGAQGDPLPPPGPADTFSAETSPATVRYRSWDWPVVLHQDQVRLGLGREVVAVLVPLYLAAPVAAILSARRCPPAVFFHPDAPEHQVFLAGEPFEVALGWPADVYRLNGTVLLPPTATPRGPLTWVHPPWPDSLRLCREVDLAAALRVAEPDPPSDAPTTF